MSDTEVAVSSSDLGRTFYHLRMGGLTLDDIAQRFNMRMSVVVRLYNSYLTHIAQRTAAESYEDDKRIEEDRLDALQQSFWTQATEFHDVPTIVGKGADAHVEMVEMPPDKDAAKVVLEVIKYRAKLKGLEAPPATDAKVVTNILVTGESTAAYLEALTQGRLKPGIGSGDPDNVVEGSVIDEVEEAQ